MSNFLTYAMKSCVYVEIYLQLFVTSALSFTTCLLYTDEGVPHSSNKMLGGPQSRSARFGGQGDS